jgi:hypothetical protein
MHVEATAEVMAVATPPSVRRWIGPVKYTQFSQVFVKQNLEVWVTFNHKMLWSPGIFSYEDR